MLTEDDKRWLDGRLDQIRAAYAERLERVETTLLTEFHSGHRLSRYASALMLPHCAR